MTLLASQSSLQKPELNNNTRLRKLQQFIRDSIRRQPIILAYFNVNVNL